MILRSPKKLKQSGRSPKRLRTGPAEAQKAQKLSIRWWCKPKKTQKWLRKWSGKSSKRRRNGPGRAQKSSEMVRAEVKKNAQKWSGRSPKRLRNGPKEQKGSGLRNGPGRAQKRLRNAKRVRNGPGSEMVRKEPRLVRGGAQKGSGPLGEDAPVRGH